jgi:hypothetical protein
VGDEVIKAKQYRVQISKEETSEDPKILDDEKIENEDFKEALDSDDQLDYENLRKKDARYFLIGNITIKCFNCDEVGHLSRNCPNEIVLHTCLRCNTKGHSEYDCPNVKCFKCNKIGHKSFECKANSQNTIKCEMCKNIGHEAEDCLVEPKKIKKSVVDKSYCFFCGQLGHIMCKAPENKFIIEDYNSDEVELSDDTDAIEDAQDVEMEGNSDPDFDTIITQNMKNKKENTGIQDTKKNIELRENAGLIKDNKTEFLKKKRKRVFNKFKNSELVEKIFCPKCGDMHSMNECTVQLRFNSFDQRRQTYSKSFFNRDDNYGKSEREVKILR